MPRKPKRSAGPPPQLEMPAGYTGPPWYDSVTYPVLPFAFTRAKNIDRSLTNMVEDFGASPESISLEPVPLTPDDPRRIMIELKFQIRGVDYCCALPVVIAPNVDDDLRIRMAKAMMRQKLKSDMQLAFQGWGMTHLMEPYRVKPVAPPAPKIYDPKTPAPKRRRKRAEPNV